MIVVATVDENEEFDAKNVVAVDVPVVVIIARDNSSNLVTIGIVVGSDIVDVDIDVGIDASIDIDVDVGVGVGVGVGVVVGVGVCVGVGVDVTVGNVEVSTLAVAFRTSGLVDGNAGVSSCPDGESRSNKSASTTSAFVTVSVFSTELEQIESSSSWSTQVSCRIRSSKDKCFDGGFFLRELERYLSRRLRRSVFLSIVLLIKSESSSREWEL